MYLILKIFMMCIIVFVKPKINASNEEIFSQVESQVASRLSVWNELDNFVRKSRADTKYFSEGRLN